MQSEDGSVFSLFIAVQETKSDGWMVEISDSTQVVSKDVFLQDPLSAQQRMTCRWYLEEFFQSPYLIDKALAAEDLLLDYPKLLMRRLNLDKLVFSRLGWDTLERNQNVAHIVVCQDNENCAGESIHRLFWETLEMPNLWNDRVQVIVRRSPSDKLVGISTKHMSDAAAVSMSPTVSVTTIFNILLVVARDLRRDSSLNYQDVSPSLAADVLLSVKKRLQQQRRPHIHLNVEIVRPGTFESFKDHLKTRGEAYFQAVHFDLHGRIGPRGKTGQRTGILYFSKREWQIPGQWEGKSTEPIACINVCRVVAKYKGN